MPEKLDAVAKFRSESDKPCAAPQAIRDRGTWWARQAETHDLHEARYCEAFHVVKAKLDVATLAALSLAGGPR